MKLSKRINWLTGIRYDGAISNKNILIYLFHRSHRIMELFGMLSRVHYLCLMGQPLENFVLYS